MKFQLHWTKRKIILYENAPKEYVHCNCAMRWLSQTQFVTHQYDKRSVYSQTDIK